MPELAVAPDAAAPVRAEGFPHPSGRQLLVFSLLVTATLGLIAAILHGPLDQRFLFTFVLLRWTVVLVLLLTPPLGRRFPGLPMPAAARTPVTAGLLTVESIVIDIISSLSH